MKFRLVEDMLEETLYRDIIEFLGIDTNGRGETSLRTFICHLIGTSPNDYILHHINGKHSDNTPQNLALLPTKQIHANLHRGVSRAMEKDSDLKQLYYDTQNDPTLIPDLRDAFESHFLIILEETPGVILVYDRLKELGVNI